MKRFSLKVKDSDFVVEGDSLDAIWPKGLPKVWEENKASIVETDITEELAERKRKAAADSAIRELFFDYTNDISYPNLKKAIRAALASGLETVKEIKDYVIKNA